MRIQLGSYCDIINGGAWSDSEYVSEGIRVVRVTNMVGDTVVSKDDKFLPERSRARYEQHRLWKGDTLIATVGSHPSQPGSVVGRTSRVPQNCDGAYLNQNAACLRIKKMEKVAPDFFWHLSKTVLFKHHIESRARGAANQVRMAISELKRFEFDFPPIGTQRKISAILTAYDDLIEVNKRRIALLEQMAEELYREWFVRLRFPGHQTTKFIKGVPVGWEMRKIEEAFEFTGGGTPSKAVSSYWSNGTVQWFTPSDITGAAGMFLSDSEDRCSEEGLARSSARMFPPYSVMMTSRATIGAIGINTKPACTNQGFITCIPNERFPLPFLYQWLKLAKPYFEQLCGGATFPELTKGTFKKLEIIAPTEVLMKEFAELSVPMFKSIEVALKQNANLAQTRDLLLPRLISGKLSVENLDVAFPPSMQGAAEAIPSDGN